MSDTEKILAALRELLEEVRGQGNLLRQLAEAPGPAGARGAGDFHLNAVFARYPQFARDFSWLAAHGYLSETGAGLVWHKSKQSLAEYFGNQEPRDRNRHWRDIEGLFNMKGLRNSLSRNGDSFKKRSRDYAELLARLARR